MHSVFEIATKVAEVNTYILHSYVHYTLTKTRQIQNDKYISEVTNHVQKVKPKLALPLRDSLFLHTPSSYAITYSYHNLVAVDKLIFEKSRSKRHYRLLRDYDVIEKEDGVSQWVPYIYLEWKLAYKNWSQRWLKLTPSASPNLLFLSARSTQIDLQCQSLSIIFRVLTSIWRRLFWFYELITCLAIQSINKMQN